MKIILSHYVKLFIFISVVSVFSCGTATTGGNTKSIIISDPEPPEDKYSVSNYVAEKPDEYARFLVKPEDYTTDGEYYHKKHERCLLGLAEVLTEKHRYNIKERSIGFYYDRLGKETDLLYLGFDVSCSQNFVDEDKNYFINGAAMIDKYLPNALEVTRRYDDILSETSVEGVVVGLFWFRRGRRELMTVWLLKQNIREFYDDHLTFRQLLIKSTVTDSDGKKIRLAL
ncbi:MAG: hypothetical protein JXK07_09285 [Spirochaetes bacterium]|nr:hypothetical protein [Spirochaetota bacterium]MBN2771524.1 hypothetical protein [Spirochaetota bacterium]